MTFEQTLIISIITAVTTGVLSILGVVLTLRQNNKQLQLQMKLQQEEKLQYIIDNCPEFEIIDYEEDVLNLGGKIVSEKCEIECIISPKLTIDDKEKEWRRVKYTIKNIGKETIEFIDLIPLGQRIYFYDFQKTGSKKFEIEAFREKEEKCITYYGDKVRSGDDIKIALWYMTEKAPTNFPIVAGCIAFKSFNKKYWRQNLHIPSKVLEESVFISEKEYNVLTKRIE